MTIDQSLAKKANALTRDHLPKRVAVHVEGMNVSYGSMANALSDFTFTAFEGQVTAVIGPNGSGKTTFLNALTGAVPFASGTVQLFGQTIVRVTPKSMNACGVSRTFQNLSLIDDLNVDKNVRLGATAETSATLLESLVTAPRARREWRARGEAAAAAMARLGIIDIRDVITAELSYGYRRRVEIARALASSPRVLLLDEPTAGMGPNESSEFAELILSLAQENGLAIVVIEHDMSVVRHAADSVYVLSAGRLVASGPADEVLANPEVKRIYLGDFGSHHA
jgi:branched-chain amino acid transport system ATP-binding protein